MTCGDIYILNDFTTITYFVWQQKADYRSPMCQASIFFFFFQRRYAKGVENSQYPSSLTHIQYVSETSE